MMSAVELREILVNGNRDVSVVELPELLEYIAVFAEFFADVKEEAFRASVLKTIYGKRLHKLLTAVEELGY